MRRARPITLPDQPDQHETHESRPKSQPISSNQITTTNSIQQNSNHEVPVINNNNTHTILSTTNNERTTCDIFPIDVYEENEQYNDRPRQMGRRAENPPRLISIAAGNITTNGVMVSKKIIEV